MADKGYLVISLDFELLWGVFDKVDYKEMKTYFKNTKDVVPAILKIFDEYEIKATWAIVGMLFNEDWKEWDGNKPSTKPNYSNRKISPYIYGDKLKKEPGETENYVFAKKLIKKIQEAPHQEIGTHTYSHYYCMEEGQSVESFRNDVQQSASLAKRMGIELKSLIFPRNQFNQNYLKVCYENGITNVRSNPSSWYWKKPQVDSLARKIFRTGDAYIGSKNKSYKLSSLKKIKGFPLSQPSSRLLRPYTSKKWLNNLKIERIKSEMTKAAKNNEIYHLWWHPHNFGKHPKENLNDLRMILNHYQHCQKLYGFKSVSMQGINELVEEK